MTSNDQPFRRPTSEGAMEPADQSAAHDAPAPPQRVDDPGVLDPEFHQSVWKPWRDDPVEDHLPQENVPSTHGTAAPAPAPRPRMASWLWVAGGAFVLVLAASLTLPAILHPDSPSPDLNPIVNDLGTAPVLSWSADYGHVCSSPDPDHSVLSDGTRVWRLDLRSGETLWTSDIGARYSTVDCLPGANAVTVTEVTATGAVISITLLDGSTGERISGFSGAQAVEVVPLGNNIGLVAPNHTLTMFAVEDLASPLWTRDLPGPEGRLQELSVEYIDDTTVRLGYFVTNSIEDASPQQSLTLSVLTGETPAWANDDPSVFNRQRVGDVVLWSRSSMDTFASNSGTGEFVTATDLEGRQLWRQQARATVVGSGLFLATQSGELHPWSRLQEVDPLTGNPRGDDAFEGEFRYVFTTAGGRPVVFQGDAIRILDRGMRPQPPIPAQNFRFLIQGREQMYLGRATDDGGETGLTSMTAVDLDTSDLVWEFELGLGQSVEQLGRHLVLVDADGETIHGLEGSP